MELLGWNCQDRTARIKQQGQDNKESTVRTARTGQTQWDIWNVTGRT
jgi:hypothetical protein